MRDLLIRGAGDDRADQVLLAPAVLHEVDGQPVEQFAILGHRRARAEVLGVSTSPSPKIACQTRFTATRAVSGDRLIGQPAGERQAISRRIRPATDERPRACAVRPRCSG